MPGWLFVRLCALRCRAANNVYIGAKERSKELLDISKAKLDEVDDELRRTFQTMEEVHRGLLKPTRPSLTHYPFYSQARPTSEARTS
jgi:hypothetical protein